MSKETEREQYGGGTEKKTLPGIGPKLGMDRLRNRKERREDSSVALGDEQAEALDLMHAQIRRYEWFAERVDTSRSLEELAAVLTRPPAAPGCWEEALVVLSLRDEVEARAFLRRWEPPEDDQELTLFYQMCVLRSG